MDGSSSGIYFTPATTQPDHFVLYLQGGGWCNDQKSCESRCGTRKNGKCSGGLATSTVWANTQYLAGLFSTSANKTALPGANKAYLRYCTGDAHMGNRDASAASFGFNFHGSRTVAAALSLLVKEHGLGSKPGQTLLFGGELTATAAAPPQAKASVFGRMAAETCMERQCRYLPPHSGQRGVGTGPKC